jgi:hypothetical protein
MTDGDRPEFLKIVTAMSEMYQRDCSAAVIDLYFQALSDLAIEQVEAAVVSLLKTAKFMPRPAEIREIIEGPPPKTSPAERAWVRLLEMTKACYECNRVECDDPALAKALKVVFGFWDAAARKLVFEGLDDIDRAVLRKDFCAAYETAMTEGVPTSGRYILRVPHVALRPGYRFMLGLSDRHGVQVLEFASEALALAWRGQKALRAAPAPAALVAHEEN